MWFNVRVIVVPLTLLAIERDQVNLGVERAKDLAKALQVHPAVLVLPALK